MSLLGIILQVYGYFNAPQGIDIYMSNMTRQAGSRSGGEHPLHGHGGDWALVKELTVSLSYNGDPIVSSRSV